jgi:hypothetical protein
MKLQDILKTKRETMGKSHYGDWKAQTTYDFADRKRLDITTMRRFNGTCSTIASVCEVSVDGSTSTHMMHQDFSSLLESVKYKRITEKVVYTQHQQINVEDVIRTVCAFYKMELV